MMTIENYADILRFAIKGQINYEMERLEKVHLLEEAYVDGIITGLRIALEKIDASSFLFEQNK